MKNIMLTLTCDDNCSFNRHLLGLVKQWDRHGRIKIMPRVSSESSRELTLLDENGTRWYGAEALPHIFKQLPFGKLAAAVYTLPGTMWVTKQLYAFNNNLNQAFLDRRAN